MTHYRINIFYSDEDGGYVADTPDLQACSTFGETPAEALSEVERAKAADFSTSMKYASFGITYLGVDRLKPRRPTLHRCISLIRWIIPDEAEIATGHLP